MLPVAALLATLVSIGCGGGDPDAGEGENASTSASETPVTFGGRPGVLGTVGEVVRSDSTISRPETLLDSLSFDVDADSTLERIALYASVHRDSSGVLHWDDAHRWLLVVEDGELDYPLYDGSVSVGGLRFAVVEPQPDGPFVIFLEQSGTAVFSVEAFTFDPRRGGFVRRDKMAATGNVWHVTPELSP